MWGCSGWGGRSRLAAYPGGAQPGGGEARVHARDGGVAVVVAVVVVQSREAPTLSPALSLDPSHARVVPDRARDHDHVHRHLVFRYAQVVR